jgi:hypothetical protein
MPYSYSYYSNSGVPRLSPEFLQWVKNVNSVSYAQQQQQQGVEGSTFMFDTTHNEILVDVVVVPKLVENELTPTHKERYVNNLVMGAVLLTDEAPIIEEMGRVSNLTQSEYSKDGFSSTTKKFNIMKVPTHHHERYEWLKIVNDRFQERLTLREYGYFERNGDVAADNLVARTPDTIDRYSSFKNKHIPGEYGSIYVHKNDFRPFYTHEQISQWQQEATNFLERLKLTEKLKSEEKQREKEAIEREKREEMYKRAHEEMKKHLKPRGVNKYHDTF